MKEDLSIFEFEVDNEDFKTIFKFFDWSMIKIIVRILNWMAFWNKFVILAKKQVVKNNLSKSKLMQNFIYEY